jgi:hypothetical protein
VFGEHTEDKEPRDENVSYVGTKDLVEVPACVFSPLLLCGHDYEGEIKKQGPEDDRQADPILSKNESVDANKIKGEVEEHREEAQGLEPNRIHTKKVVGVVALVNEELFKFKRTISNVSEGWVQAREYG